MLHLITVSGEEGRSPLEELSRDIRKELKAYSPEPRAARSRALAKADLPDVQEPTWSQTRVRKNGC